MLYRNFTFAFFPASKHDIYFPFGNHIIIIIIIIIVIIIVIIIIIIIISYRLSSFNNSSKPALQYLVKKLGAKIHDPKWF